MVPFSMSASAMVVIYTDDDEVASLATLGDEWSFHIETEYFF